MKEEVLKLLPGVQAVGENDRLGLTRNGQMRLTTDGRQIALLRALLSGPQPLSTLLHIKSDPHGGDAFAALALAEFILSFEDYLEK